ncbi:MAG: nuclear transport factor 2 family protein [Oscillospiraceae bacterium]|jgi:hypothetical protein
MAEKEMVFTNDELARRVWEKECIVQLINRHRYYYGNDMRREELSRLWVRKPENRATASLGNNIGYYMGMDEIARHYVLDRDKLRYERLKAYCDADPGIEYSSKNLGLGIGAIHTATTPVVNIADDGRTAQYLGYGLNYKAYGKPDGSADAYFDFGLIFADLMKEDGEWKIWHLVLQHDHTVEVGSDYSKVPVLRAFGEDPLELEFGNPTVAANVYNPLYGWEYIYQDMPKPYYSYTDKDGYGPGGDLGKAYYERERR